MPALSMVAGGRVCQKSDKQEKENLVTHTESGYQGCQKSDKAEKA